MGILDFRAGAGTDIAALVDDKDLVRHIDLALVHIVQHFLHAVRPHLIISRMPEQPH